LLNIKTKRPQQTSLKGKELKRSRHTATKEAWGKWTHN